MTDKKRRRGHGINLRFVSCLSELPVQPQSTRKLWMKVRSKDWWERVVLYEFSDVDWKQNFRMTRASFIKLCGLVEGFMAPEEITVRAPIPCMMRVPMVLYRLGSCAEYRLVANQFGVHKSTVRKFTYNFCKGVVGRLINELICLLNEQEASEIGRRFEAAHFIPQIMGLIDGTHIPILPPSEGYKDFVNRKGWPSYVLQAVVDDRCCFRSISCKMPGSAHDANVLRQSDLFQRAHLLPKSVKNIEGEDVRLFIIGDPAYPLLDWLMKGYITSPFMTREQESFNVHLSEVRVGVEMAFGILKSRWRVLLKRSDFHFTFAPTMISTCCALHNFCQMERDFANSNWLEDLRPLPRLYPGEPAQPVNHLCNTTGNNARAALTRYMASHFPLRVH